MGVYSKVCTKCRKEKRLNEFYKNKECKYGYHSQCIECLSLKGKVWRDKKFKDEREKRSSLKESLKKSPTKKCSSCNKIKYKNQFYKHDQTVDGYRGQCKSCRKEKDKILNKNRVLTNEQRTIHNKKRKLRNEKNRLKVLYHYSQGSMKCKCCGESHLEFLSLDHINGNGKQHRIEIKNTNINSWLIKRSFPEGYRVLCMNCNTSLGFRGYCPHENI